MKFRKTLLSAVAVAVVSNWVSAKPASAEVPNLRLDPTRPIGSLRMRPDASATSAWTRSELGRVQFNSRGDQRTAKARSLHSINEAGMIRGEEFMNQVTPDSIAAMVYEQTLTAHPKKIDPNKSPAQLWREYRQKLADRAMAVLILNRILDNEAMKRKFEPGVSEARVSYILRSVLIQFGINTGKLATETRTLDGKTQMGNPAEKDPCNRKQETVLTENMSSRTDAEMFAWVRSAFEVATTEHVVKSDLDSKQAGGLSKAEIRSIADRMELKFDVDWSNGAAMGLAMEQDALRGAKDIGWPLVSQDRVEGNGAKCVLYRTGEEQSVKMVFTGAKFPKNVEEMRAAIREQLQQTYRPYLRMAIWRGLVMQARPMASWENMFAVTDEQLRHMYDALKGDFVEIVRNTGTLVEVRVEGKRAKAFEKMYLKLLDAGEAAHKAEFDPADESVISTAEGRMVWMKRMTELRQQIQEVAYQKTLKKFGADIKAGRLSVLTHPQKITRSAGEQSELPLAAQTFAEQAADKVSDVQFFTSRLVPRLMGTENSSRRRVIMTMTDLTLDPVYKSKHDPLVDQVLRARVSSRLQGRIFRRLAYDLFRLNPFQFTLSFCSDPSWPCSLAGDREQGPRILAEALFPETLYPGLTLDSSGGAAMSTLRDDSQFDRVQEISISELERVFMVPND